MNSLFKKYLVIISQFVFVLFLSNPLEAFSQTDKKLLSLLEQTIDGFNGNIGIYVKNLKTGKTTAINGDTIFPTASIVKVPILVGVMDKIRTGELDYNQELIY